MVKELRDILIEMNRMGATIVLNSHVLSEIEMICNKAAIMDRGRVIAQENMSTLRGMGLETYQVEFEPLDPLPEYLRVTIKTPTAIKGEIPTERLQRVRAARGRRRQAGLRMHAQAPDAGGFVLQDTERGERHPRRRREPVNR